MTEFEPKYPTAEEIRDAQILADRMRGEAMAAGLNHVIRFFAKLPRKIVASPSCARPLRS
ncbi:MAG: hypothetical protein GJ676_16100 [Rhodobacteraceae bacterium]|nr:hypothetical protein [Paracoccaceae bacterium]